MLMAGSDGRLLREGRRPGLAEEARGYCSVHKVRDTAEVPRLPVR